MSEDLNSFLYHLNDTIQHLQQQVASLSLEVDLLKTKVKELEARPPIHVDNISYKFDQLKVESLEGSLSIGISPSDAESLAEFSVNGENPLSPYMFADRELLIQQLANEALAYLESEKSHLLQQAAQMSEAPFDEQIAQFVIEDLYNQLPQRIKVYLDETPIYDRTVDRLPAVTERIRERIKFDIDRAVLDFINQPKPGEEKK